MHKVLISSDFSQASLLELLAGMFAEDQALRRELATAEDPEFIRQQMGLLDAKNTARVKNLIAQYGWEEIVAFGGNELWHLVQHSDHDVDFQIEALGEFRRHQPCSITVWQCAFLEDRICMNQGKPQIYGSQLWRSKVTREWEVYLLAHPEKVDERRARVGLGPLVEYISKMNSK